MSTNTTQTTEPRQNGASKLPTHVAKLRRGYGKQASYERIGVAWQNEDGSFYVKPHGTQIIGEGFYIYRLEEPEPAAE